MPSLQYFYNTKKNDIACAVLSLMFGLMLAGVGFAELNRTDISKTKQGFSAISSGLGVLLIIMSAVTTVNLCRISRSPEATRLISGTN